MRRDPTNMWQCTMRDWNMLESTVRTVRTFSVGVPCTRVLTY